MLKNPWLLVILLLVALLGALAYIVHQADLIEARDRQIAAFSPQRDLPGGVTVSGTTVGTAADVSAAGNDAGLPMGTIGNDANRNGGAVTGVNVVRTTSDGQQGTGIASSGSIPRIRKAPTGDPVLPGGDPGDPGGDRHIDGPGGGGKLPEPVDPWGYQNAEQVLRVEESFGGGKERIPFGQVGFRAWEKNPWTLSVPPRTYTVATALATDDEGKQTAYNRLTIEVDGKSYVVPIKTAQLTEKLHEPRWRWSGKLYLGAAAGVRVPAAGAEVVPSALVSVGSYGKTPLMPEWTVGAVGVGYATQSHRPAVVVAPVLWNAGKPMPLIDNLYAGPSVSADTSGAVSIMVGVHVKM